MFERDKYFYIILHTSDPQKYEYPSPKERVVSAPRYTRTLRKSVGQADSHRLQPIQSSVRGADAICFALQPFQETISRTSVGHARTHCVHPIQVL